MLWIYLAILAYFLDAVVFLIDKYLLSDTNGVPHPSAYAFFSAALSSFALLLLPFGVHIPSWLDLAISLTSGITFFFGIIFLYNAVKHIDVTEVMPAIGAVTAVCSFALSFWLLPGMPVTSHELLALSLLVGGTLLMSYFHLSSRVVLDILFAGLLTALSFVLLKLMFNHTDFINGLFWSRLGFVAGALIVLMFPKSRAEIWGVLHHSSHNSKFVFLANKALAAGVFIMIYYAIRIGNVVFVNAAQGIQYVFTLVLGAALVKAFPKLFEKHAEKFVSVRKLIATACIIAGIAFLFI